LQAGQAAIILAAERPEAAPIPPEPSELAKGTVTGALSYTQLEEAFAADLQSRRDASQGAVWVLVPTNLLALHLRRETARGLGGLAAVEFLTLTDAARRIALYSLAAKGARALPPGAAELALERLLEDVPPGSYLAPFRRFVNGPGAIADAISILEESLWTPAALEKAATGRGSGRLRAGDQAAPTRLRELARIWARLNDWKEANALFDDGDVVRQAGQCLAPEAARDDVELPPRCTAADVRQGMPGAERPDLLCVYGFYDLSPSQLRLVGRLVSLARACSAYMLWGEEGGRPLPGFEYALPAVEWLVEALRAGRIRSLPGSPSRTDLARLRQEAFREKPLIPEDRARELLAQRRPAFDGSVRVLSCPGELPEASETVRQVLRWAERSPEHPSVGILLRGAEGAAGLMAESLERAGLRWYQREGMPLAQSVAGRIALGLLDLAVAQAERAAVVDFLALAEVEWPRGLSASALDRVTRLAGIIRGRADWEGRLRRLAEQFRRDAERAEHETERDTFARDMELAAAAAAFLSDFFGKLALLRDPKDWHGAARQLRALVAEYAPADDAGTAPVVEAVDELSAVAVSGAAPSVQRMRRLLERRLAGQSLKRERFQHTGCAVSSIMAARGATFDLVIVPGLVEKGFPRHIAEHSLLTELDREALNPLADRLGCGQLPLQKRRPDEERYLFRIALGSARRGIVLTYPRLEQDSGRPRIPSRFLTDACSALAGVTVNARMLEEGLPAGLVQRVPLVRRAWAPEELGLALDALEYDAGVFVGPSGTALRTGYMCAVSEAFARALRMEEGRWHRPDFGPYDGKIRAPDLLERLRERYASFAAPISPSRFETYARCPFEYFLTYLLEIGEVEAPSEEFQLPPLERGALVHELLSEVYADLLKGRPLGGLTDDEIAAAVARGAEVLGRLGRVHAENHPATWAAERERALAELGAILRHERAAHADAAPELFEYEFGISSPAPFALELGSKASVAFHGRIDRVDRLAERAIQIVDYKTGRSGKYSADSFAGGRQLQLPIYLLAAARLLEAQEASALYMMVDRAKDVPEFTLESLNARMEDFRRALRLTIEGIASGDFFPLPAETSDAQRSCGEYCRYKAACGAARQNLAEMKATDPDASRLAALREIT
jgi:RecB family exonuclease